MVYSVMVEGDDNHIPSKKPESIRDREIVLRTFHMLVIFDFMSADISFQEANQ